MGESTVFSFDNSLYCAVRLERVIPLIESENKITELFNKFDKRVDYHIFFEGQIYDAYSLLLDIVNKSKNEIIIIDNYIDKHILDNYK